MFVIPNSSAMDATAYGGGPGTFVAQIATGSPESIDALVAQRLKQAEQFLALINQARSAAQTLSKAWSGQASDTAVKKITDTLESFEQIVKVIQTSSQLLATSSTLIKTAQTGFTTAVNAVNPTVASLASNWWTYWAAVSLSTSVSATLRAFINGIEAMLSALGGGQLMQEVATVIQIIGDIEKLIGSGSHGNTVPPTGSYAIPAATGTAGRLQAPPPVASATGQQVAASGLDPAAAATLSHYQTLMNSGIGTQFQNTAAPTGGGVPYTPPQLPVTDGPTIPDQYAASHPIQLENQDAGWVAVNPPAGSDTPVMAHPIAPVLTDPTAPVHSTPATPPGDITVTTTYDGVSTTVTMPIGTQTDVTLIDPANGSQVHEHIMAGVSQNA